MNLRFLTNLAQRDPATVWRFGVHFPNVVRLHWRLLRDPRVSLPAKAILLAGVLYFVSPVDLIPDFPLIGLGWVDDLLVMAMASQLFMSLCPPRVVQEHVRLIDEGG
ncbi:MAG TPA: DUF1232 domain-containing protein [Armatimonadota bacterium]|jgi:uncharacterized membrane protein YkvA (DUF1232 family)